MAGTLRDVLQARNLIGRIVDIVNGIPEDILPPGFATANRTTEGAEGEYLRVQGTRQTATISRYGAASKNVAPAGIGKTPVTLLHSIESFTHDPTLLNLLIEETGTGLVRQQMARETIERQLDVFGTRFKNLRMASIYSVLGTGGIGFDASGNLLPPSATWGVNSAAVDPINFGVPTGNTGSLNVFGTGNLLTNWVYNSSSNPSPGILTQLKKVKKAARKLTGYPLKYAFYGEDVPGIIAMDPVIQAIIRGSARVAEETLSAEIPDAVGQLKWIPIDQAFYVDQNGVFQDWYSPYSLILTPEPSTDWWEVIEGTYPVPRSIQLASDLAAVLGNIQQVAGPFSYAQITTDPTGLKHTSGDTFLPVLKNAAAIFQAIVPTS
jgi:hypothetical protein